MYRFLSLVFAFVFLANVSMLFGQAYVVQESIGEEAYLENVQSNAGLALFPPANDQLSRWQDLPFTWNFYGQDVSGYYISDNGYITFDEKATNSVANNTSLPTTAAPNNAIYAFWADLELVGAQPILTNEVRSLTWGSAPNRVHVIIWMAVVPEGRNPGALNNMTFGIALHENADFDVFFASGRTIGTIPGTIGSENSDGTFATVIDGSPEIPYPKLTTNPSDDLVYRFRQTDVQYDAATDGIDIPAKVILNEPVDVVGKVRNVGAEVINSFDYNYRIDDGPVQTTTVSGLALATNQTETVTPEMPWTPDKGGKVYTISAWVSNINGADIDENADNDMATAESFAYLNVSGEKRVLLEEFTGNWCGWCTDGAYQVERTLAIYDKVAAVAIHAGGNDAMIIPEGTEYAQAFRPAYPQAMIDRLDLDEDGKIPTNRSNDAWLNQAAQALNGETPAEVRINKNYDESTRQLEVTVNVYFVDYMLPQDLRLMLYVLEDNVVGEGPGYDQANYLSGRSGYEGHPMYDEPATIKGFVHNHVLRAVPSGAWGVRVTGPFAAGQTFSETFTYKIPPEFDEEKISLIGFVYNFDDNVLNRGIMNCAEVHLASSPTNVKEENEVLSVGHLQPNPASQMAFIDVSLTETSPLSVELYSLLGHKIQTIKNGYSTAGNHLLAVNSSELHEGMYLVRVKAGDQIHWRKLQVMR